MGQSDSVKKHQPSVEARKIAASLGVIGGNPHSKVLARMVAELLIKGMSIDAVTEAVKASPRYLENQRQSKSKRKRIKVITTRGVIAEQKRNIVFKKSMRSSMTRDELRRRRAEHEEQRASANEARLSAEREKVEQHQRIAMQSEEENLPEIIRRELPVTVHRDFQLWFHRTGRLMNISSTQIVAAFKVEFGLNEPLAVVVEENEKPVSEAVAVIAPVFQPQSLPDKRTGRVVSITSRPDQSKFADAVSVNCRYRCVVTGAKTRARCEAAHLDENKAGGVDHYTNGLLLRSDIHGLFDAGLCAIDPATMVMYFHGSVLADDPDLQAYHAKQITAPRRPINPDYLTLRWQIFNLINEATYSPDGEKDEAIQT